MSETTSNWLQQWKDRERRRAGGSPRAVIRENRRDPRSFYKRLGGVRGTNLEFIRQVGERLVYLTDLTVLVRAVAPRENARSHCHRDQSNQAHNYAACQSRYAANAEPATAAP